MLYNVKKRFGEYKVKWEFIVEMKDMLIYLKLVLESRNIVEDVIIDS